MQPAVYMPDGYLVMKDVVHDAKSPVHRLVETEFEWHWEDMISSLRDEDIDFLCHGDPRHPEAQPTVRSGGLVSCRAELDQKSFDVAMARMDDKKHAGRPENRTFKDVPLSLDFVVARTDGVSFRLHPNNNDNKVACKTTDESIATPVPRDIYTTEGQGHFQRCQNWKVLKHLRFNMGAVREARRLADRAVNI